MAEPLGRVWIATTNHRKFIIEAETRDEAADMFQEKMGYYPQSWQLDLMETPDGVDSEGAPAPTE